MSLTIGELLAEESEQQKTAIENYLNNLRVATPGYIVDFDPEKQTATVQPTIQESVNGEWISLPQLLDVPVQFPQAGGYSLTFPVKQGDECLVVFSDMCIDSWWQSGGIQVQLEKRRHDLSDAMAILGFSSVPNAIQNFSGDTVQLRNESGNTFLEIQEDTITIKSKKLVFDIEESVNLRAPTSNLTTALGVTGPTTITGSTVVNGSISAGAGGGNATIEGDISILGNLSVANNATVGDTVTAEEAFIKDIQFTEHVHSGVIEGEDNTEVPVPEREDEVDPEEESL